MDIAVSINKIHIRLTDERWRHITISHNDMAAHFYDILETIENPKWVFHGDEENEFWAVKPFEERKVFLVIYKELKQERDGFIITAFITGKITKLLKRKILWQQLPR